MPMDLAPSVCPLVDGQDAAADGLCHVRAGVDGDDEKRRGQPVELNPRVEEAVVDEHRLNHHGRAAEHFHVNHQNRAHHEEDEPLDGVVLLADGYRLDNADDIADDAADKGADGGNQQRDARAAEERAPVFVENIKYPTNKILRHLIPLSEITGKRPLPRLCRTGYSIPVQAFAVKRLHDFSGIYSDMGCTAMAGHHALEVINRQLLEGVVEEV